MTTRTQLITADDLLRMPDDGFRSLADIAILSDKEMLDGRDVVPAWKISVADLFA